MAPPRKEQRLGHAHTAKGAVKPRVATARRYPQPKGNSEWHPMAGAWWRAVGMSSESRNYEPSDWMTAYVAAEVLDKLYTFGFAPGLLAEFGKMCARLRAPRFEDIAEPEPVVDADEVAGVTTLESWKRKLQG